ncbi:MAG: prepilin-type N-terminal cleavage/methylation domain-containing protein [Candidatus Omnitrophica bacterium]|nr:prepilin-type N-terminal cleavage/methylation domain-containing protein [Candidatus Omnitrophota bacterium]
MKRAFTLLELIVVIVILGILATLGYTQYTKVVERSRMAEVVANFNKMRQLAYVYYWQNGTLATITTADLSIGSDIPSSCVSTNYFWYYILGPSSTNVEIVAGRCTANGKPPQYSCQYYPFVVLNPVNGDGAWNVDKSSGSCPSAPSW